MSNDDLDTLRPEVADAVSALDETTCMTNPGLKWYATIRAERLRLAALEHAWQQWIKDGMRVEFLPPEQPK